MDNLRELPRQWVNIVRYGNELGGPAQERHTALLHQSVERYRSFYQLPDYITDKARNVDVHIVTRHQLNTFIAHELRNEYELLRRTSRWGPEEEYLERQALDINVKLTQELSKRGFGFTFPLRHRTAVLIAQEQEKVEETIDHEALHVLSGRALNQGTGFQSGIEFFYPGGPSEGLVVNEAMTEALRLVSANPGLSAPQLNDLVREDKIWFGYKDEVRVLLGLLVAAQGNNEAPFDIKAQAPLYFGFDNLRVVEARRQFMANLERSLSEEDRRILHLRIHKESPDYHTLGDLKSNRNETTL